MNKYKIRIILLLSLLLVIPMLSFLVQDKVNMNNSYAYESKLNDETLISKHPLVSRIYDDYFDESDEAPEELSIKNISNLSKEKQKEVKEIKEAFEIEIQKLVQSGILPKEYIEYENDWKIDFGQISIYRRRQVVDLDQIYRLNTNNDRVISYVMDLETKKIIGINISASDLRMISLERQGELLKKILEYLEFDDIDDWSFSPYGMESYKARLQLSYRYYNYSEDAQYINVSLSPYGEMTDNYFSISN